MFCDIADVLTTIDATVPAKATRREWIGLAVLALAALAYVMDLTVLHLAVPKMSAELQPSSAQLLWIIDIYGFLVAGALITMGTLGDRIGRRRLLLVGAAAFAITSVLCRLLDDSGDAHRQPGGTRHRRRDARAIDPGADLLHVPGPTRADGCHRRVDRSLLGGSAIGPVLGGIALEFFWWGSVFLLAIPVMVALLILGPRILPESRDENAGRLDLASAAMAVVAVLAVIFGLKQIAQEGIGPVAIAAVIGGLLVGALWVRRQARLADPMIDLTLFRAPKFGAALVINFLAIFVAVGYFLFVAQYLQLVAGLTPFQAGMLSLPSAIAFVVGSQAAPRIVQRIKPAYLISGGLAFGSLGLFLLTQVPATDGLVPIVVASVIISLGLAPGVRADDRAHRRLGAP